MVSTIHKSDVACGFRSLRIVLYIMSFFTILKLHRLSYSMEINESIVENELCCILFFFFISHVFYISRITPCTIVTHSFWTRQNTTHLCMKTTQIHKRHNSDCSLQFLYDIYHTEAMETRLFVFVSTQRTDHQSTNIRNNLHIGKRWTPKHVFACYPILIRTRTNTIERTNLCTICMPPFPLQTIRRKPFIYSTRTFTR